MAISFPISQELAQGNLIFRSLTSISFSMSLDPPWHFSFYLTLQNCLSSSFHIRLLSQEKTASAHVYDLLNFIVSVDRKHNKCSYWTLYNPTLPCIMCGHPGPGLCSECLSTLNMTIAENDLGKQKHMAKRSSSLKSKAFKFVKSGFKPHFWTLRRRTIYLTSLSLRQLSYL